MSDTQMSTEFLTEEDLKRTDDVLLGAMTNLHSILHDHLTFKETGAVPPAEILANEGARELVRRVRTDKDVGRLLTKCVLECENFKRVFDAAVEEAIESYNLTPCVEGVLDQILDDSVSDVLGNMRRSLATEEYVDDAIRDLENTYVGEQWVKDEIRDSVRELEDDVEGKLEDLYDKITLEGGYDERVAAVLDARMASLGLWDRLRWLFTGRLPAPKEMDR